MTDATVDTVAIVQRDQEKWEKKLKVNAAMMFAHAARKSGRSVPAVAWEAFKLSRGKGRIQFDEYVKFRLYDKAAHTEEERNEFITWLLHYRIIHLANDKQWFGVTEDKWLSSVLLEKDGVPVPHTVGMIDVSGRRYHGTDAIASPEALKSCLQTAEFPLFGKHNSGLGSIGVFIITGADNEFVHLRDHGAVTYAKFFENFIGQDTFILQHVVRNHEFIARHSEAAATVRVVNMLDGKGVFVPNAVLKLPSARNHADNFWREGNMLCDVDPETGEIRTIVTADGLDLKHHTAHPETGAALIGQRLPHWDQLREVNEKVAKLHTPLNYQSCDIALTQNGPVVIEVNAGSDFGLPQMAKGKGIMTSKVRELFRSYGAEEYVWA